MTPIYLGEESKNSFMNYDIDTLEEFKQIKFGREINFRIFTLNDNKADIEVFTMANTVYVKCDNNYIYPSPKNKTELVKIIQILLTNIFCHALKLWVLIIIAKNLIVRLL